MYIIMLMRRRIKLEYKLTPRQKELIELAKKRGFLTLEDFNAVYSSPISRKANLERFVALKILESDKIMGKFNYIGKK